jgi:hypothetical protein
MKSHPLPPPRPRVARVCTQVITLASRSPNASRAFAWKALALIAALLAITALVGCASQGTRNERDAEENLQISTEPAHLMSYRIRNWSAPNDRTLILESYDGQKYKAELIAPCFGLNFANRLAFTNRGGFSQIDQFSSVVLPDGTRCAFHSFNRLITPESKALDESHGKPNATPR